MNPEGLLGYATAPGSSSFADFLGSAATELLPHQAPAGHAAEPFMHATTIVTATYADGVVMAGDRRATMGNLIAQKDIEKVFACDDYSLVGIAGTAGIAIELVRLFQVELEHYEKIEGTPLTLDGKANRLATMIRNNLGAAMQGLAVVPLFAGFDVAGNAAPSSDGGAARIYSYDVTGGRYPERFYHSVGSGSVFAKSSLKKRWQPDLTEDAAISVVLEALYDAADDDSATGGPDIARGIYPVVFTASAEGTRRIPDTAVAPMVQSLIERRTGQPGV